MSEVTVLFFQGIMFFSRSFTWRGVALRITSLFIIEGQIAYPNGVFCLVILSLVMSEEVPSPDVTDTCDT
jgi:hypothetical protein